MFFLLFYGCSTTFRGPQNSRFMTLTDGGADTLKGLSHEIDFKNVDENGQILALLRAAAGF
jgi:hypothetical protein